MLLSSSLSVFAAFAVVVASLLFRTFKRSRSKDADAIIGSGFLDIWLASLSILLANPVLIQRGYNKYRGRLYKIPLLWKEIIVVSGDHIDELLSAPESVLSFYHAVDQLLQSRYVFGSKVLDNPYHGQLLTTKLNRNLSETFPAILDEIIKVCDENLNQPVNAVPGYPFSVKAIARISSRVFNGSQLCHDPEFIQLGINFTVGAIGAGVILSLFPASLRPFALRYLTPIPKYTAALQAKLSPLIQQRRDTPHDDMLGWIVTAAPPEDKSDDHALTLRALHLMFASLHTTAMTFSHALFYVASSPQYIVPLRQEISEVVEQYGWTKAAVDNMQKLDSFMQECQRHGGLGSINLLRKVLQPYRFSDGTKAPIGAMLVVPIEAIHLDECHYENASQFDGFRFTNADKSTLISSSKSYMAFGRGKHSWYPGRFFAAMEMKLLMSCLIARYDLRIDSPSGERPMDEWYGTNRVPNTTARVVFKQREYDETGSLIVS